MTYTYFPFNWSAKVNSVYKQGKNMSVYDIFVDTDVTQ